MAMACGSVGRLVANLIAQARAAGRIRTWNSIFFIKRVDGSGLCSKMKMNDEIV